MRHLGWFAFAALLLSTVAALGKDEKTQADTLLNFVVGDYVIVAAIRTAARHTPAKPASNPGRADCY